MDEERNKDSAAIHSTCLRVHILFCQCVEKARKHPTLIYPPAYVLVWVCQYQIYTLVSTFIKRCFSWWMSTAAKRKQLSTSVRAPCIINVEAEPLCVCVIYYYCSSFTVCIMNTKTTTAEDRVQRGVNMEFSAMTAIITAKHCEPVTLLGVRTGLHFSKVTGKLGCSGNRCHIGSVDDGMCGFRGRSWTPPAELKLEYCSTKQK